MVAPDIKSRCVFTLDGLDLPPWSRVVYLTDSPPFTVESMILSTFWCREPLTLATLVACNVRKLYSDTSDPEMPRYYVPASLMVQADPSSVRLVDFLIETLNMEMQRDDSTQ